MHMDTNEVITVSREALDQFLALYQAGYLPDSPALRDKATALGWHECARLDRVVACNLAATVVLPDGSRRTGLDLMDAVDWSRETSATMSGVRIENTPLEGKE